MTRHERKEKEKETEKTTKRRWKNEKVQQLNEHFETGNAITSSDVCKYTTSNLWDHEQVCKGIKILSISPNRVREGIATELSLFSKFGQISCVEFDQGVTVGEDPESMTQAQGNFAKFSVKFPLKFICPNSNTERRDKLGTSHVLGV